ncbi:permease-like cell division protein FtsX [Paludicola sp. MB14-C6]|uniref:permease-like cell division protein FtsX n=1 Tax=Paludihabitans sp. MB14-C6 TaxID=3070656 RepID=UPI0027DC4E50|nr:permease-like cell division protein FtsX [Paludicola sp. MB14-C6]WMJ23568.1 permease-like cell division protein FtsX [Paludicola sp. MB14-C6]
MKGSSFKYLLKEGIRSLWRNRVMAFTSVGVLATCLIIVGAAYLIKVNVDSMVGYIQNQTEMVVFLKQDADQATIDNVKSAIQKNANISKLTYVSKAQGLENTKKMLGNEGYLLDGLENRNTIPDMFELKVKDLSLTEQTVKELKTIAGVDIVQASNEVAHTLTYVQRTVNTFGSILIIALGIISLVIIANTIRATIFTRRKEINIMKYVGATNTFIRIPFIVEGFMLGLISAFIAFIVIWGGYHYLTAFVVEDASIWVKSALESIIPFKDLALTVGGFFTVTGTLLGTVGSVISIRNHARV